MKHFVINLDRQPERLRRMEAVFGGLGLTFTRVPAVDGRLMTAAEIAERSDLQSGETACFLSHRECWRRVVEEDLPYAGIFEDDLHFGEGAASLFANGDWVPNEAHLIKLETKYKRVRVDASPIQAIGNRTLYRLRSKHAGSGGYVVTQAGARKLLAMSPRLYAPVDMFMFNPKHSSAATLLALQLTPAVCVQDAVVKDPSMTLGLGSDLIKERLARKLVGSKKLWHEVRRPFLKLSDRVGVILSSLEANKKWIFVEFS